ncbi:MAG: hypothetical protein PHZ07_03080 [Patescibacteria group bacterium]|nr:hypothetical protein [Patescibacteria group bacterium]MDD4304394.1 hypothetical protein [Patescibacteria group bacterium]MDD4695417.1 hypothetical protein [Patescibacteria group bacterium]
MYNNNTTIRKNNFKSRRSLFSNKKNSFNRKIVNEYFYKRDSIKWQSKVMIFFLIFVFVYFIYLFLFSKYFKIEQVIVSGNQDIPTKDIQILTHDFLNKRRLIFLKNNNYFLFNSKKLKSILSSDYSLVELNIDKKYFSSIFIELKEKPCKVVYEIGDGKFLVDEDAIVASKIEKYDKKDYIIIKEIPRSILANEQEIKDQELKMVNDPIYQHTSSTVFISKEAEDGGVVIEEVPRIQEVMKDVYPEYPEIDKNIFDKEILERIMYLDNSYFEKFEQQKRKHYEFQINDNGYITMITDGGIKIYFKLDDSLDSQLTNLYRYVVEEKKYDLKNVQYIDLRQKSQIIIK